MINEGGYRWSERSACLASLSPSLAGDLELAWAGVVQYWQAGGGEDDIWQSCNNQTRRADIMTRKGLQ